MGRVLCGPSWHGPSWFWAELSCTPLIFSLSVGSDPASTVHPPKKKYQEFQAPQKIFEILATPKKIPILYIDLKKDPKMPPPLLFSPLTPPPPDT